MSILPKVIYTFNTIPMKMPMSYLTELEQIFQKIIWNHKRPQIATVTLRKNSKVRGIVKSNIKLCYKATLIKTAWYWHKNRQIVQWNRTDSPEKNPFFYIQLIFHKGDKSMQWSKDSFFNKWCRENWTSTFKQKKVDHQLTPYTRK